MSAVTQPLRPADERELAEIIRDAAQTGRRLRLRSGGSKDDFGAPLTDAAWLELSAIRGIVDHDAAEMVLTVRAGTPLADITALLANARQMLAFEPWDVGPLYGRPSGSASIGGIVATGIGGSQRLTQGSVRDHLLGFHAVSGRGESFQAGGKVVKNVTGYDLPKLMAGSWGRLAALSELTLRVLPLPEYVRTVMLIGQDTSAAIAAMATALGSQAEVAAAAHLPAPGGARTLLRLQGFEASVRARTELLCELLRTFGDAQWLEGAEATALWQPLRDLAPLASLPMLWRVCVPPAQGATLLHSPELADARWLMDWAGGLVWLGGEFDATALRERVAVLGGHAQLWRAAPELRARIPALHPQEAALRSLNERVRRAFDPNGVFDPARWHSSDTVHA